MSEERQDSRRPSADDLQKAFEEAASGLDLQLEPAGGEATRCIGVAFMIYANIPYDIDENAPPIHHHDDVEIEQLIQAHESLTPAQYRDGSWQSYLFQTHMVVAKSGLIEANQTVIDQWLDSAYFREFQEEYPWKDPRDVKIQAVKITNLGRQMAAATYRVREELANGKAIAGNAATLLARLEQVGWRGVVITKGERKES